MIERAFLVLDGFNVVVLTYFVVINLSYLLLTLIAFRQLRKYSRRLKSIHVDELVSAAGAPPVTLIAPAYNEEATCVEAVRSLLTLEYPEYEILVVNDGSKDRTLEALAAAYDLIPAVRLPTASIATAAVRGVYRSRHYANLWVIDKENGGKADALNVGINHCRTPYFCGMDADTLLERDALARAIRPFLENRHTVAAGGIIRIVNGCTVKYGAVTAVRLPKNKTAAMQVLEYLRAFLSARMGWSALDSMLIISGAFGVFRRSAVVEVGGYYTDTVGEDMELVVRLHRHFLEKKQPYRIAFVPDPVAWTECPEDLKVLGRQRDRWQRGLYQTLARHKVMMLNPRYGRIGMLAFPYFFFLEMLGPVVEVAGYFTFALAFIVGRYDGVHAAAFMSVAIVFGIANSIAAVGLEELSFRRYAKLKDVLRLMWLSVVENFGYRQMNMYWRLRGLLSARTAKKGWGAMVRKGFNSQTAAIVALALFTTADEARGQLRATLQTHYEAFAGADENWDDWTFSSAAVERKSKVGSVALEGLHARRFGRDDFGAAIDVYRQFDRRTYANVRLQVVPDAAILPGTDLTLELFRTIATGWEGSVGYRRADYESSEVDLISVGVGHYRGHWYLRPRFTFVRQQGNTVHHVSGVARRYLGASYEFAELAVSAGEEAVTVGLPSVVDLRSTLSVSARVQRLLTASFGGIVGITYAEFEDIPTRRGAQLGLFLVF